MPKKQDAKVGQLVDFDRYRALDRLDLQIASFVLFYGNLLNVVAPDGGF